jgi:Spy/CpxP family protein refolding chaperone
MLVILLMVYAFPGFSQEIPRSSQERFNAQRIAFFTERLRLTPEEAQEFWPVYNEYQDEKNQIIEKRRELTRNLVQNQQTLSDDKIEELGDEYVASVIEEAELLAIYHARFKEVLPVRKVPRIYQTENQFKNYLLRQIQKSQQRRAPGGI